MAFLARVTYNVASNTYSVPFEFLHRDHLDVYLDSTLKTITTDYTIASGGGSVTFVVAGVPTTPVGTTVTLRRVTPTDPYVDFGDASRVTERNLDDALKQACFLGEEAQDDNQANLHEDTAGTYWDGDSQQIKDVDDPTLAQDVATKAYVDLQVIESGNVVAPVNPTDDGKLLQAGGGLWAWTALLVAKISDASANARSFLQAANYAAMRTALDVPTIAVAANATQLTAGTVNTARLGTGTASAGSYLRGDNTWVVNPKGQCYLSKSGANLLLAPKNGNLITINSLDVVIPDAGVTLAPGGLGASTFYYIYAFVSGSTLTLEASATGHDVQAGTGVRIKSGDATRTFVGVAMTTAGTAWEDTATAIHVLSYFNRLKKTGLGVFTADRSTASTTIVEFNSEIRVSFLTIDEPVHISLTGNALAQNLFAFVGIGIAGTTIYSGCGGFGTNVGGEGFPIGQEVDTLLATGQSFATVVGMANSSTVTLNADADSNTTGMTRLRVTVRG